MLDLKYSLLVMILLIISCSVAKEWGVEEELLKSALEDCEHIWSADVDIEDKSVQISIETDIVDPLDFYEAIGYVYGSYAALVQMKPDCTGDLNVSLCNLQKNPYITPTSFYFLYSWALESDLDDGKSIQAGGLKALSTLEFDEGSETTSSSLFLEQPLYKADTVDVSFGTRENPVPMLDYKVTLSDGWEITVLNVIPDATQIVLNENMFNGPPKDGHQFFLAKIRACYTGSDSDTFDGGYRLRAVGASNVAYSTFENNCGVIPDELPDSEVFTGGCIEGYVGWEIKSSDAYSLVMYDKPFSFGETERIYFSLVA